MNPLLETLSRDQDCEIPMHMSRSPKRPKPFTTSLVGNVLELVCQPRVGYVEPDGASDPAQRRRGRRWRGHLGPLRQPPQLRVAGNPDLDLTDGPPRGPPPLPGALPPMATELVRQLVDAAEPQRNLDQGISQIIRASNLG